MDTSTVSQLLKPDEAAKFLNVSPHTVIHWRRSGTGPKHLKVGKHVRYRLSDLEAFLLPSQATGESIE